jgi:hypothetical protein
MVKALQDSYFLHSHSNTIVILRLQRAFCSITMNTNAHASVSVYIRQKPHNVWCDSNLHESDSYI